MTAVHFGSLLRHVRSMAGPDGLSDAQLLERFRAGREDAAFAALMRRHGRMVWGVCRHVLGHEQDAEDAYQATFLVLAKNANAVRKGEAVGSWLHGAAYRIAMRAKRDAAIRRKHEGRITPGVNAPGSPVELREALAVLDEEVRGLPDRPRAAFVLCCVEGKSLAEAARALGWTEGTVSGTLARARQRLRARLTRRGIALTAALAATSLTRQPASAALSHSTLQAALRVAAGGAVPAAVAALVHGATKTMISTKLKIACVVLTAAGIVAGLLASQDAKPQAEAKSPAAVKDVKPSDVELSGRVLDPDGKPVAGAKLYWPRILKKEPLTQEDFHWAEKAVSDADGRFRLALTAQEKEAAPRPYLVAAADGFGLGWVELAKDEKHSELTLSLVKDVPVQGRVLDTQGKPLAGVRISVTGILVTGKERTDEFLNIWKKSWHDTWLVAKQPLYGLMNQLLQAAATDKDGRFTIRGLGSERVASVEVQGPAIAKTMIYLVTRPGFDPKPFNQAAHDFAGGRNVENIPLLYGPALDFIASPTRVIEGVIRDVDTGKPIAGARLWTNTGYGSGVNAVSDAQGHYKLAGLPKRDEYLVGVSPPSDKEGNLIPRTIAVRGPEGLGPIKQDIELAHGVVVTGRIVDKVTGKGVRGGVRFVPLPQNKFFGKKPGYDGYRRDRTMLGSDADGTFRIVIIPGAGVLMAQVHGGTRIDGVEVNPYKQARFDPADRELAKPSRNGEDWIFTAAENSLEFLNIEHAVKVLDFPEGAGPATVTLTVDPGKTLQVRVEDADGQPLPGAIASGVTASWPGVMQLKKAECTVFALDPEEPRQLVFLHPQRKLAGSLTLRGDEKEPPVVRLMPTGGIAGRLLDLDGQALAGVEITPSGEKNTTRELYRHLAPQSQPVRTDQEGRFRIDGLVPGVQFSLGLHKGRTYYVGEPRIGLRQVEPGKVLDLGDVKIKPAQ